MSRRKEKIVPLNKETVMKLYHIQIGEELQQKDLAEDLNCSPEHLNRRLNEGECAESFRDKIAKYLNVHPDLLSKEYTETINWLDLLTEQEISVAPEDVMTYQFYKTMEQVKDSARDIISRVVNPVRTYIYAIGMKDRFNSLSEDQQLFMCSMVRQYVDDIFTVAEKLPEDRHGEYQDWHRNAIKDYLGK